MTVLRWLWSAPVLALMLARPAHAVTTLVSPELSVLGTDTAICRIVNAGAKEIAVTIQLVGGDGSIVVEKETRVAPGNSDINVGDGFSSGGFYCRFIGAFSKSLVRASVDLVDPDFRTTVIAPAN